MSIQRWYSRRERGLPMLAGVENSIYHSLYRSMVLTTTPWSFGDTADPAARQLNPGMIYSKPSIHSMDFAPSGSTLGAAFSNGNFALYDPRNNRRVQTVVSAHAEALNGIKFLKEDTLATCGDDMTAKLWDARNLSASVRTLHGHDSPVKMLDYYQQDNVLVTTAYDGQAYGWDLNNQTSENVTFRRLVMMSGMLCCRLSPSGDRMVMTTTNGFMVVVNNLNLDTLYEDMKGFQPNLLHLAQTQRQPMAVLKGTSPMLRRTRNRLLIISDYPCAGVNITNSLTIHPQGWCVLSRNSTSTDVEWNTIHDIRNWPFAPLRDDDDDDPDESRDGPEEARNVDGNDEADLNVSDPIVETMELPRGADAEPAVAADSPSFIASDPCGSRAAAPHCTNRATNTNANVCMCPVVPIAPAVANVNAPSSSHPGERSEAGTSTSLTIPPGGTNRCVCLQGIGSDPTPSGSGWSAGGGPRAFVPPVLAGRSGIPAAVNGSAGPGQSVPGPSGAAGSGSVASGSRAFVRPAVAGISSIQPISAPGPSGAAGPGNVASGPRAFVRPAVGGISVITPILHRWTAARQSAPGPSRDAGSANVASGPFASVPHVVAGLSAMRAILQRAAAPAQSAPVPSSAAGSSIGVSGPRASVQPAVAGPSGIRATVDVSAAARGEVTPPRVAAAANAFISGPRAIAQPVHAGPSGIPSASGALRLPTPGPSHGPGVTARNWTALFGSSLAREFPMAMPSSTASRAARINASQFPMPSRRRRREESDEDDDESESESEQQHNGDGRQGNRNRYRIREHLNHPARDWLAPNSPAVRIEVEPHQRHRIVLQPNEVEPAEPAQPPPPDMWLATVKVANRYTPINRLTHRSVLRGVLSGIQPNDRMPAWMLPQERLLFYSRQFVHCSRYFIEQSFSADGRLICSPDPQGVRLLAFNDHCAEVQTVARRTPQRLHEVALLDGSSNVYLSCRFSPREPLLATGSFTGEVQFFMPAI